MKSFTLLYVDLDLCIQVTVDEIVLGHYIGRIHLDLDKQSNSVPLSCLYNCEAICLWISGPCYFNLVWWMLKQDISIHLECSRLKGLVVYFQILLLLHYAIWLLCFDLRQRFKFWLCIIDGRPSFDFKRTKLDTVFNRYMFTTYK